MSRSSNAWRRSQRDPQTGRSYPNLLLDLAVLDLADRSDTVDLRWVDDRRDPAVALADTLRHAPASWRRWVREGRPAIPRVRRRVLTSTVRTADEQRPPAGTPDRALLDDVYRHFDGRKHAFELIASRIAGSLLGRSGAGYDPGWLTRSGGDGGVDFVGRLDVGDASTSTPLVVLGQAKCVEPGSSISPDEVARVVARLRRGWIGVFVTTGVFSRQAQVEVIDDAYPLLLVPGQVVVEQVRLLAARATTATSARSCGRCRRVTRTRSRAAAPRRSSPPEARFADPAAVALSSSSRRLGRSPPRPHPRG